VLGLNLVKPTPSKQGTPTNGANLIIKRDYTVTALQVFTNGYIFTNWTASIDGGEPTNIVSTSLSYTFTMQTNLKVSANYITNPFLIYQGSYNGLFYETNEIKHASAGYVTLKVTPKFAVSGKLTVDGNTVSFGGKFALDGTFTNTVKRAVKLDKTNLNIALKINFGAETVTGTVVNPDPTNGWTSELTADHYVWSTNNPATGYINNYTLVVPAFTNSVEGPAGFGGAALNIATNGKVKFLGGTLADKAPIKQATFLSPTGVLPIYVPLYVSSRTVSSGAVVKESHGEVIGWLNVVTNAVGTNLAPQGTVTWINASTNDLFWPAGFTNEVDVLSSRYVGAAPILSWTNGVADVSGADLASSFSAALTLTTNKLFATLPLTNSFKAGLALKTGLVKGTMDVPALKTTWSGVILQDYDTAKGYFTGTNSAGKVEIHGPAVD